VTPRVFESVPVGFLLPSDVGLQRRRDRILLVLAVIAAVVLVARAARKDDGVLRRNVEFGARFLAHEDPYEDPARGHRVHGPYPPSYALVTAPLSLLPVPLARVTWAIAQVAALASCLFLARRWASRAWPALLPHTSVVFGLALMLASRFVLRDMAGGGGNVLFATLAAWGIELALVRRPLAAGFLLALPLVQKPNLAPLVLALACFGLWRALVCTLASALLLYWLPAFHSGFAAFAELTTRWVRDVAAFGAARDLADPRAIPDGFPLADTTMNQSVRESLWRFLPPDAAAWSARAITVLLLAAACIVALRARGPRSRILAATGFFAVCVLVSPISWKAHHAALLPLFAALCFAALSERRRWLVLLLVAYYVACVLLSEELVGKAAKELLQEISVVACGAFALFLAAAALSGRERAT
jgi:hypothetical protein